MDRWTGWTQRKVVSKLFVYIHYFYNPFTKFAKDYKYSVALYIDF